MIEVGKPFYSQLIITIPCFRGCNKVVIRYTGCSIPSFLMDNTRNDDHRRKGCPITTNGFTHRNKLWIGRAPEVGLAVGISCNDLLVSANTNTKASLIEVILVRWLNIVLLAYGMVFIKPSTNIVRLMCFFSDPNRLSSAFEYGIQDAGQGSMMPSDRRLEVQDLNWNVHMLGSHLHNWKPFVGEH